jgi:hypothetical protein
VKARYYVINYWSIARLNPLGIIPKGTPVDYTQPHDRAWLAKLGPRRAARARAALGPTDLNSPCDERARRGNLGPDRLASSPSATAAA